MNRLFIVLLLLLCICLISAERLSSSSKSLVLIFKGTTPDDEAAVREYQAIWEKEWETIIKALEEHSGLKFQETEVHANVEEAPSYSGYGNIPMRLRSSYPLDTKREALIHELGHRLQNDLFLKDEEDHPYLFLYLHDVWVSVYGKEFADEQVKVESARRGHYDYESAWKTALAMTPEQRREKWQEFLKTKTAN
jgi:hypothetical protein